MDPVKELIQQKYGEAALKAQSGKTAGCGCGTSGCGGTDPITSNLYDEAQAGAIPAAAMRAFRRSQAQPGTVSDRLCAQRER